MVIKNKYKLQDVEYKQNPIMATKHPIAVNTQKNTFRYMNKIEKGQYFSLM